MIAYGIDKQSLGELHAEMINMKYCVVVKISKLRLNFWYRIDDEKFSALSMEDSSNIPLCFYVNGNDFKIGEFAKDRLLMNDKNAYYEYFNLIKDPSNYFLLHGDSKPIKQLLFYGIENYLSYFLKTILYKNESIEGFRTNFCLRFWFEDDVENQEKILVENLFKEAGYENVAEINTYYYLNNEITKELNLNQARVILTEINNDLYIKLFNSIDFNFLGKIKLDKLDADPRAKILAKLILEDIKEANPHISIDEDKETAYIIDHCVQLLSSIKPIMINGIELSNGIKIDYKIRKSQLDERLMYNRGIEDKVIPQMESLLSSYGLINSQFDIILIGDDLNTNYFKEKLTKKFPNVYGLGTMVEAKILNSAFTVINFKEYQEKDIIKDENNSKVELSSVNRKAPFSITNEKINITQSEKNLSIEKNANNSEFESAPVRPKSDEPSQADMSINVIIPLPPVQKMMVPPPPPPPPPPVKKKV